MNHTIGLTCQNSVPVIGSRYAKSPDAGDRARVDSRFFFAVDVKRCQLHALSPRYGGNGVFTNIAT